MTTNKCILFTRRIGMPVITAAIIISSGIISSCSRAQEWRISEGAVWHTTYRIVYDSPVSLDDSVTAIFNAVDRSLSPFNPISLISRINRNETNETDSLIDRVMDVSQIVNRESHGRFDPTVAPLVNLWGFGTDKQARQRAETDSAGFTVSQTQIDSALTMVGIADCHISNSRISKKHPATSFNFSAVTKGYACDLVADMLMRNNVENFMVEIGGEVVVAGHNPEHRQWHIQVDAPDTTAPDSHNSLRILAVTNCGIATSGNYRNYHDTSRYGRFGHTIDPVKGTPVTTNLLSATIIAPTAAMADAWATACMASDADSALAIINRQPNVECLLVTLADSTLTIISSQGFPK